MRPLTASHLEIKSESTNELSLILELKTIFKEIMDSLNSISLRMCFYSYLAGCNKLMKNLNTSYSVQGK